MKKDDKFKNLKRNDSLTEDDLDMPYKNYKEELVTLRG